MAELRIRNLSKELAAKIKLMEKEFRTPESSTAITRLINKYFEDQKTIKDLQVRNTQLHAAIKKYYDKEAAMLRHIQSITAMVAGESKQLQQYAKVFKSMQKHFTKKKSK